MTEVDRIQDQLRRAFKGGAWHGPSVMEALKGVDARRAAARPITRAHSIWEIVLHVAAWENVVRRRLRGEWFKPSPAQNWPVPRRVDPASWRAAIARLVRGHEALRRAVARLDDAKLMTPFKGRKYGPYFILHGVIQHDLYHAGQIAVLKKGG